MSVDILLAKAFLILVVCLVVRNNSCGSFWYSKYFLLHLNMDPALYFAADFSFFNCVFVKFNSQFLIVCHSLQYCYTSLRKF